VSIQAGITEDDIANYLANTPGFFERHAELLASIQLSSPHGASAVSLQQRQIDLMREKTKVLERRIMDMRRHGLDNETIADRLHRFVLVLLGENEPTALPDVVVAAITSEFVIPHAALRLWGVADEHAQQPFALGVSDDVRTLVGSLAKPYCGLNAGFEAAAWLAADQPIASTALIPLRRADGEAPFGLLVLGSPDPQRYTADMGTDFLARIGEVAAAALSRLLPAA
jgi:uncharacterized protein YigA (DUF484 family)